MNLDLHSGGNFFKNPNTYSPKRSGGIKNSFDLRTFQRSELNCKNMNKKVAEYEIDNKSGDGASLQISNTTIVFKSYVLNYLRIIQI